MCTLAWPSALETVTTSTPAASGLLAKECVGRGTAPRECPLCAAPGAGLCVGGRSSACPAGATAAVRDAQTLPELHAACPAARLHAELLQPRGEPLHAMPSGPPATGRRLRPLRS